MPADPRVHDAVATCRHQWSRMGLSGARIADMTSELGAHLCDALADGRTIDSVTGPDLAAFAQEWARENAPAGLQRWWVERRRRVPLYAAVVAFHQWSLWGGITPAPDGEGIPLSFALALFSLMLASEVLGLLLVWRYRPAGGMLLVFAAWLGLLVPEAGFQALAVGLLGGLEIWRSLVEQADAERDEPRPASAVRWWQFDDRRSRLGRWWFAAGAWESCARHGYVWSPSVRYEGVRVARSALAHPWRRSIRQGTVFIVAFLWFNAWMRVTDPPDWSPFFLLVPAILFVELLALLPMTQRRLVRRARKIIEWHDPDLAAEHPWQPPGFF